MTYLYNTTDLTQVNLLAKVNSSNQEILKNRPKSLNYSEIKARKESIKFLALLGLKYEKNPNPLKVFEYCADSSDWQTGELYHSLERISHNMGLSISTIQRAFDVLVKKGFIYKRRRGFKENNLYSIRFDQITKDSYKARKSSIVKYESPSQPRKYHTQVNNQKLSSSSSSLRKEKEEISINTSSTSSFEMTKALKKERSQVIIQTPNPEEPVQMNEKWEPKEITIRNIAKELDFSRSFIEEDLVGFRLYAIKQGRKHTNDAWNRLFYNWCRGTKNRQSEYSNFIAYSARHHHKESVSYGFVEARPARTLAEAKVEARYTPPTPLPSIERHEWSEEEKQKAEAELEMRLKQNEEYLREYASIRKRRIFIC